MPRLWRRTMDAHRDAVREASVEAAAALVAERGIRGVTMSEIAARTGIGRATLYKYFPDVESILVAWHDRQVAGHVAGLEQLRTSDAPPLERLGALLETYGLMQHEMRHAHGTEVAAMLHRHEHVARARRHLRGFLRELLAECVAGGQVRDDVAPDELAGFCLHAMSGAAAVGSAAAVRRLVAVTLAGLRPSPPAASGGVGERQLTAPAVDRE